MAIFVDTANFDDVKEAYSLGVVSGVTTNPKLFSQEAGVTFKDRVLEICEFAKGPVSVELTSETYKDMIDEAAEYAGWHKNIVIKVPMGYEGLKVVNILERTKNVRTNVTAIMATNQAYFAAMAGATYVSIFWGRVKDLGYDSAIVVEETRQLLDTYELPSQIIVGSIRHIMDINEASLAGAHILTIPFKFFKLMTVHPNTDATINEFNAAWRETIKKGLLK